MSQESLQEETSAYDAEWDLDTDVPQATANTGAGDDPQSDDEFTDSEPAATDEPEATSNEPEVKAEVPDTDEDIWANATEAQKLAIRRAENERQSAANRARQHENSLAERGRELKALREEKLALEKASQTPTEFESSHEVYGADINTMIERKLADLNLPVTHPEDVKAPEQIEQEVFDVITNAHPDAGDIFNSPGCQQMLEDNPAIKVDGKAYSFSDVLLSEDPNLAVHGLSYYKSTLSAPAPTALEAMQVADTVSGKPDMRTSTQYTEAEAYDAEWDTDE